MIKDPIPFLANIALVAYADGKLSESELGQLEAIRQEYRFKKSEYNAAVHLVESSDYKITLVGSFADQVRNLELILRVAYADDDLDESEILIIQDFCRTIGIHQEQLDRLCREVITSLKQQTLICPSCGAEAAVDALFCSKCGSGFGSSAQEVHVQFLMPESGIAIKFADSTAASFSKALGIAKATPGYQTCQNGKKCWHLAVFPSGQLPDAMPLAAALSSVRNKSLYMDGQEMPWNEVFGFTWCASQRAMAYRPAEYCFGKDENRLNLWGCKQAGLDWTEWADWFCYGKWEKAGVINQKLQWRFNKDRILHEVQTKMYRCRFCPYVKMELVEAVIQNFPDTVIPDTDRGWEYHQQYEEVPGAIKVVQKEGSAGCFFTNEFWADGVKPIGLNIFADILLKSAQDIGLSPLLVKSLVK